MPNKNTEKDYQKEIEKSIKMFDVAKPDTSRPDATSRPVIVGHKAAIGADPMVKEAVPPAVGDVVPVRKRKKTAAAHPKKIKTNNPTSISAKTEPATKIVIKHPQATIKTETATVTDKKHSNELEESVIKSEQSEQKTERVRLQPLIKPEAESIVKDKVVEALVEQVPDKKHDDKELVDTAVRLEEIQKSIETREFYLPITTSEQKRNVRFVVVVVLLIIIAAAAAFVFGPEREKINSLLNLK